MYIRASLLTCLLLAACTSQNVICPNECSCFLDTKGRNVVECKQGHMIGPLLFTNMSTSIEILKITAPEDNMNDLSMNPNIQNYRSLEEVYITRSNIPNLGVNFFFGLTKMEILNLSQNNITQLLPENFRFLIKLKELILDDNRIFSLPSETFRYLTELKVLSIQRNRIEKLNHGVFRGLAKLRVLKLNGNYIGNFDQEVFKDFKELRVLECRGCSITKINTVVHALIAQLTHLDLSDNSLEEINPTDYSDLKKLKVLKLDGNQVTILPDKMLANHTELKKLSVARNKISKIQINAFYNLKNLSELDLGYNKLEHIDKEVMKSATKTIEILILSGNRVGINDIKYLLVDTLLKDLQIADCGLAEIAEQFAPATTSILNLCGNQLSYLPAYVLPRDVKDLDLSKNMFRGLEEDTVERLVNCRVKLDNNPWSCDLCHIIPMLENVNKSAAFYNVRCSLPYHHANKILGTLQREQLSWCSATGYSSGGVNFFLSRDDGRLGIMAAGASILLLLLTVLAVLTALCYSRRHAAKYYTHEEKRCDERESIFENPSPLFGEELSFKFPLELNEKKISIATIDEIKKDHGLSNGT